MRSFDRRRTDRVLKAVVRCPREDKVRAAELLEVAQALKRLRVDKLEDGLGGRSVPGCWRGGPRGRGGRGRGVRLRTSEPLTARTPPVRVCACVHALSRRMCPWMLSLIHLYE